MGHKNKEGGKKAAAARRRWEGLIGTVRQLQPQGRGRTRWSSRTCAWRCSTTSSPPQPRWRRRQGVASSVLLGASSCRSTRGHRRRAPRHLRRVAVSIKKGSAAPAFAKEARLASCSVGLSRAHPPRRRRHGDLAKSFPILARTLQEPIVHGPGSGGRRARLPRPSLSPAGLAREDAERSLKAIWGVASAAQLVSAALSTWTFLLTTATITDAQRKADRAAWNATVASLAGLLQADDRAVRMAAGEALAVCVELNLTQHTPRKDMEAVQARVSDLAAEAGGKGADRALLVEQKELFRAGLGVHGARRAAQEGAADVVGPAQVHQGVVVGQDGAAQLPAAVPRRRFLSHVKGNKLLKESFDAGADEKSTLSIAKRKLSMKTKDKVMKMNCEQAWAAKNVYCIPQGGPPESNRPEQLLKLGWH
ncbi:unnamed protein product [Miscanthus lutarioriparius]|uniref:Interferon-related developmental regulator N-terminal domain-containing protein n=1 Tax=Miscanthus lutarioriparius TaxID=422564 RepID=A0A811PJG7_9POAL|nr:unnamed protein product [Miscanthus lutarioriparius]